MNAYLYFFLLIIPSFIQAQLVKPEWSDQYIRTVRAPDPERMVRGQPGELIAISFSNNPHAGNRPLTPVATRFDKDMKKVVENELFTSDRLVYFHDIYNFKGNVYLLTKQFNKQEKFTSLYSRQIDPATLQIMDSIEIGEFEAINRNRQPDIKIKISSDTSRILVFTEAPYVNTEPEKFYVHVLDNTMHTIWNKVITLPYRNKFITIEGFDISNDGEVYVMIKHYDREVRRERIRENGVPVPSYTYKILVFEKNSNKPREHIINLQNKFVHDAALQFDADGNINLMGLYKNKNKGYVSGHFITELDKTRHQVEVQKLDTFPVDDLLTLLQKDWCGSARPRDPGLSDRFIVIGTNKRNDGSIDLLTEYNYSYVDSDSNSSKTVYVANDIVVINYKKDGSAVYTRIPKRQRDDNDSDYMSFKWMNHSDDLLLFYNDSEKNVKRDLSKRPNGMLITKSVFVVAAVDEKGALQRQVAYSNKDKKLITIMNVSEVIDTNVLALYAQRTRAFSKTKFQFGRLKL